MNVKLEVECKKEYRMDEILEAIANLSYKVEIHLQEGKIIVHDVEEEEKQKVIEYIGQYYKISEIEEENPILTAEEERILQGIITQITKGRQFANMPERNRVGYLKGIYNEIRLFQQDSGTYVHSNYEGKIFECNFTVSLFGENYGRWRVLVLEETETCCQVIPIAWKWAKKIRENSICMEMQPGIDVCYSFTEEYYSNMRFLCLDRIQKINKKRIMGRCIGEVTTEFLQKVWMQINDYSLQKAKEVGTVNYALHKILQEGFSTRESTEEWEKQVPCILEKIGVDPNADIMIKAFIAACKVETIEWKSILNAMQQEFPTRSKKSLKEELQQNFKEWLEGYPNVAQKYQRISLMHLLKAFAEKEKESRKTNEL